MKLEDLPKRYQDQARAQLGFTPMQGRGAKYNNVKSGTNEEVYPELAGRSFPSKLERDVAKYLVILLRAKEIKGLEFQPKVLLTKAECVYHPDFYFKERFDGKWRKVWVEAKGKKTYPYTTNRNLWTVYGPGLLRVIVDGGKGTLRVLEEIQP